MILFRRNATSLTHVGCWGWRCGLPSACVPSSFTWRDRTLRLRCSSPHPILVLTTHSCGCA
eukprot:scaffold118539_cov31-Tisochrysis_lutea.AAC.8